MDPMTVNERISLAIEPKPAEPIEARDEPPVFDSWPLSNGRAWYLASRYEDGDVLHWEPRPWLTDESANAMLLEMMSNANAYVWIEWDINEWCVIWKRTTQEEGDEPSIEHSDPDRKTAIAQAFLSWKESVIPQKGER